MLFSSDERRTMLLAPDSVFFLIAFIVRLSVWYLTSGREAERAGYLQRAIFSTISRYGNFVKTVMSERISL
jgi:hypothetical protein